MAKSNQQTPLLERYHSHVKRQESARKWQTDWQRTRTALEAQDEACQALPGMAHDIDNQFVSQSLHRNAGDGENGDRTVATSQLYEDISGDTTHSRAVDSPSLVNDTKPSTVELERNFHKERDLRKTYQTRLREAEVRISDLERELSEAQASLNESLAQDQQEEIQKQQRIIANLRERLNEVEENRSVARKQCRDSEYTIWELESELRRLRFSAATVENDSDMKARHTFEQVNAPLHKPKGPIEQTPSNESKVRLADTRKTKSPKLARQPGHIIPYLLT